jgi:excisionase family DNA binding protein
MLMADNRAELVADGLMTVPEAQAFSRLSRSNLYGLMEDGSLAYCKVGRRRLIPRRALVEMMGRGVVMREAACV